MTAIAIKGNDYRGRCGHICPRAEASCLLSGRTKLLLEVVDITKPRYTTRYPALVVFMNPKPGPTRVNRALRNVLVKCGQVSSGNWQVSQKENLVTDADPGFVDAAKSIPWSRRSCSPNRRWPTKKQRASMLRDLNYPESYLTDAGRLRLNCPLVGRQF